MIEVQYKGPWTLDGRCMADAHFKPVVSDTAEETPRRHNDLKDRSGEQHMCTYNARRARCAASRPTAQRVAAPVGVLCLRHASAGR